MEKPQLNDDIKVVRFKDYMSVTNNVTAELLSRIHHNITDHDIISSFLISVDDYTVAQLPTSVLLGSSNDYEQEIQVWSYDHWRTVESTTLSTDYDRVRFSRATNIDTLRRKVKEHAQYSFVARSDQENGQERVIKYSFINVCPQCRIILGTRQEITKSLEHDFLTGGLNREGLLRELAIKFEERPTNVQYSVVCFNIKNFRVINELHGSDIGDKVLQHMYTSLVYSELSPLSYARIESDNFICLIRRDHLDTDVINRLCHQECVVGEHKVVYRCLCGIYHLDDDQIHPYNACSYARLATTFIKDQYITPWIVFNPKMQQADISDSEMLDQIETAIDNDELVPFFQPVVESATGRIVMAEALVRWQSREHGLISPGLFIPVLERHGGLSRIDQLMEQRVFDLQRYRIEQGLPVVPVDLNLSWTDFADSKLVSQLQQHILDERVPTDLIRYEITESAYEEIADNRIDVLSFLDSHNVKLLVDDFGKGYSFGTMKNVNFFIMKLDKSLIDQIGKNRKMDLLVQSMINIFHDLNSKVVAEGVETEQQLRFLQQAGCDYIQGYYFYKPMDEASFLALLEQQEQATTLANKAESESTVEPQCFETNLQEQVNTLAADLKLMQEKNRSLQLLLDEMNIHYFEWNVATHDDIASEKFCQMYNLPSNIIPNIPEVCPLCLEEDRDRFRAFYQRAERGEKMGSDYFRLYSPVGKGYIWYRKTFYTLFDQKGMPSKAIITMQDCSDKYQFRMLRSRDRMLTKEQEIVTFIYTVSDDTFSFNFPSPSGEVVSISLPNYLHTPIEKMTPDQGYLASTILDRINNGPRTGYIDFADIRLNTEFRAHYTMIDGEYGQLYAIIGQAQDINKTRERLEAKEQLLRLSEIDGLTQIYNRSAGERLMVECLQKNEPGVFAILDCDNFKQVNDTYGHVIGDALLVELARVLKDNNEQGINIRLGGDEFAFFINGIHTREDVEKSVKSFFNALGEIKIEGMEGYPISVSMGAVIIDGNSNSDFDSLYRSADVLLYQSKKYRGNKLTM